MASLTWAPTGAKWTLKKALAIGPLKLLSMRTEERAELAQFLRSQYAARRAQFTRAGVTGYAMVKLEEDMQEVSEKLGIDMNPHDTVVRTRGGKRYLSKVYAERKNPQNVLATYITLMQDFFNSKSSTVKGWRKIGLEQDLRLFGAKSKRASKTPKYRMSDDERVNFWKVYHELTKTEYTKVQDYSSESQYMVAQLWQSGDFDKSDFEVAYARLSELLNSRPDFLPESSPGDPKDPFQPGGELDDSQFQW